jgi:hypothetical protein
MFGGLPPTLVCVTSIRDSVADSLAMRATAAPTITVTVRPSASACPVGGTLDCVLFHSAPPNVAAGDSAARASSAT